MKRWVTLEVQNWYVCNVSVQFVYGVLILVSLTGKTNTDTERYVTDTLRPEVLVQTSVHTNIRGSHLLLSKLSDFLDGLWCPPLESAKKIRK